MPLPSDAYPHTTRDGQQIRLDAVKPLQLDSIVFNSGTGSALDAGPYVADAQYVLLATEACVVRFNGVATIAPIAALGVMLGANERASILLPTGATGFSAIGLTTAGKLFILRVETWAGIVDTAMLETQ